MEVLNQIEEDEVPIYDCKRRGEWLFFYCPVCNVEHCHPAAEFLKSGEQAHRWSHCITAEGKAFHNRGYYISWRENR